MNVHTILYAMIIMKQSEEIGQSSNLIHYAYEYLSFNLINFPSNGNILEKLVRISYFTTNLLDKYQIYTSAKPMYFDDLYKDFVVKNKKLMTYLGVSYNTAKKFELEKNIIKEKFVDLLY